MTDLAEFRLRIEPGSTPTSFRVEASGAGGDRTGTFELPFTDTQLENFILKVGRTRHGVRRIESPEMELARTFGGMLFGAIMAGKIGETFRAADAAARARGEGLRVTLSLTEVPRLAAIPWEFLYDAPDFLATSARTPVVRYLDVPRPWRPFELNLPIRILAVISSPAGYPPLDTARERQHLETALAPLKQTGSIAIDWIEHTTLLGLTRKMRQVDYHILHFIGHGGFDDAHKEGALLFEDQDGLPDIVGADRLAAVLRDRPSLQLVVLNSCEGARGSVDDPFSGVAASLIEREVPAVIGMQFEITDRAAILFATEFYTILAEGKPVDTAVAEARLAIFADQNDVEWATPVLFIRVADGRLFEIVDAVPIARVKPDLPPKEDDAGRKPRDGPIPPAKGFLAWFRRLPTSVRALAGLAVAVPVALILLLVLLPKEGAAIDVGETAGKPWTVTVAGSGYEASELIDINLNDRAKRTVRADAEGAFTVDVPVDADQGFVTASGRSSGRTDDDDYSLQVAQGSESPGTSVEPSMSPSAPASASVEPSTSPSAPASASVEPSEASSHAASTEPSICHTSNDVAEFVPLQDVPPGSIVFHSDFSDVSTQNDNELYAIDPQTGRIYQLTSNGVDDENPSWYAGDYHALAFARGPDGDRDIQLLYEGGTDVPLFKDGTDDWFPAWSADKTVAFVRGKQPSSIWTYVGGAGVSGQPKWEGDIVRGPAWSPDGTQLSFFGNLAAKDYDIGMTPPLKGHDPVTRIEPTFELNPTWSPDGQTLALVRGTGQSETNDIYLFDIANEKLSGPFPADPAKRAGQDGNPVWSPDGSQIAFYKVSSTGFHIWLMNVDGSGACDLMPNRPGQNLDPNWR